MQVPLLLLHVGGSGCSSGVVSQCVQVTNTVRAGMSSDFERRPTVLHERDPYSVCVSLDLTRMPDL